MTISLQRARAIGLILCTTFLLALPLKAQLVLQTTHQGSYAFNSSYPLTPALHQATLASLYRAPADAAERNVVAGYVTFALPAFTGSISNALLTVDYSGAFHQGNATALLSVAAWDVQTPTGELTQGPFNLPVSSGPGRDLLTGQSYGVDSATTGSFQMKTLQLSLNAAFREAANAFSSGGTLALGLALAPPPGADQFSMQLLTVQPGDAHIQLHLTLANGPFTPVPEPTTFAAGGLILLAGIILRRRIQSRFVGAAGAAF